MSYKIVTIPSFDKELKILSKRHRSIPKDYKKSDQENISDKELRNLIQSLGLV